MNLQKSEVKQGILRDLAVRFDEQKEALEKIVEQAVGAKTALVKMAKDIQALHGHADRDLDEGRITDLDVLKLVKLYVTRAMEGCQNQAKHFEIMEIRQRGRLEQADIQVKMVEKLYKDEETRLRAVLAAIDDGTVTVDGSDISVAENPPSNVVPMRPTGTRPGKSIGQRRKEEAKAAEAVAKTPEAVVETLSESDESPAAEKPKNGRKKRRKAKAKGNSVDVTPDPG